MQEANYISITEFQQMNPELDFTGYDNTTISGMITRASRFMDNYLQYSLTIENVQNEKTEASISADGNLIVFTRKFPIVEVTAIALKLGTVQLDLNLTDGNGNARYEIPSRARSILYPYQEISMTGTFSIRNFYQLREREIYTMTSYRAGYETIPDDLKDACSLLAKDVFIRQSNPMDLKSVSQGAVAMSWNDRSETGDTVWKKQAKDILNSYRKYYA